MRQHRFFTRFAIGALAFTVSMSSFLVPGTSGQAHAAHHETGASATEEVFELRTYHVNEGKMDALHNRFRDHTLALFARHGMRNVMYWTPVDTPNTLIYVIAHKSQDAAAASWKAFVSDPEWQSAYAKSIENGQLVHKIDSVFMSKTDYSP